MYRSQMEKYDIGLEVSDCASKNQNASEDDYEMLDMMDLLDQSHLAEPQEVQGVKEEEILDVSNIEDAPPENVKKSKSKFGRGVMSSYIRKIRDIKASMTRLGNKAYKLNRFIRKNSQLAEELKIDATSKSDHMLVEAILRRAERAQIDLDACKLKLSRLERELNEFKKSEAKAERLKKLYKL